ncbi:MAG: ATP-binding cassette domain-containing protein, partial [bacterium]
MSVLKAIELQKIYSLRKVVNNVSLEINQGEIVGLLGPNGAGKTTTFYILVGLTKPNKGKIFIDDKDITYLPLHKKSRYGISYLLQE